MDEAEPMEREPLPPDGYLQPTRYKHPFRCLRCGHVYSRISTKAVIPEVPCPKMKCRVAREVEAKLEADENMAQMLEERRAPPTIGSTGVRAIDKTAEIVMADHHLTNLNDNLRPGDVMAPKLPKRQQDAADGFFSGAEVARQAGGRRMQARVNQLGAMALSGGLRSSSINPARIQQAAGFEPGASPLRLVRTEKAR